ncbi:MAG: hypothetical protein WB952_13975 [Terriglobales bacterium]
MSEQRRKRKQEREQEGRPNALRPKIAIVVVVVAILGGLLWFLRQKQTSRLDSFAHCLSDKGAKMYGAYWCPHCADQKELFGSSFQYAPYIECGIKGSRELNPVCTQANIKHFPTWEFADGTRVEGAHPLEFLGQTTGCALP